MAELDGADIKLDPYFSDFLKRLEQRVSSFDVTDVNGKHFSLAPGAQRKLLLATAINMLGADHGEDAVSSLVEEIARLVPEMQAKGWLKSDYQSQHEKKRQKAEAIVKRMPIGFNATQELVVPDEIPSNEKYLKLKWCGEVDSLFGANERICSMNDANQVYGLTLSHDGIIVERYFEDGDLVASGDMVALMAIKVPID